MKGNLKKKIVLDQPKVCFFIVIVIVLNQKLKCSILTVSKCLFQAFNFFIKII